MALMWSSEWRHDLLHNIPKNVPIYRKYSIYNPHQKLLSKLLLEHLRYKDVSISKKIMQAYRDNRKIPKEMNSDQIFSALEWQSQEKYVKKYFSNIDI